MKVQGVDLDFADGVLLNCVHHHILLSGEQELKERERERERGIEIQKTISSQCPVRSVIVKSRLFRVKIRGRSLKHIHLHYSK